MTEQAEHKPLCREHSITLYTSVLDLAKTEVSVIWTRYSAFLVVIGFIVAAMAQKEVDKILLICTNILGIITCIIWYVMNFCGWSNQNHFYIKAHKLITPHTELTKIHADLALPTDEKKTNPTGPIYILAQLLPVILYNFFLYFLIENLKMKFNCLSIFLWIISGVIIIYIPYFYNFFFKKKGVIL